MNKVFRDILSSTEFQEEYFVAEIQARLANMLDDKGVSRAELARKLDVSRARVSQIFSDDATNFTLRLLVRAFLALDEEPVIITKNEYEMLKEKSNSVNIKDDVGINIETDRGDIALPSSLIAEFLRANVNFDASPSDKFVRRNASTRDWAEAGSNVVPLKEVGT